MVRMPPLSSRRSEHVPSAELEGSTVSRVQRPFRLDVAAVEAVVAILESSAVEEAVAIEVSNVAAVQSAS